MKIVYSDRKLGRSAQMELQLDKASVLLNKKIGESVDGTFMGLTGAKLQITGGSDKSGFPMEKSMEGTGKVKVMKALAKSGKQKGQYKRESKRGNMISADTEQVNLVVLEYGDRPAEEIFPKKEAAPEKKEEVKEEKKEERKEEVKEQKKEEKKTEKREEKKAEATA